MDKGHEFYHVVLRVGAGGSYANDPDLETAIERCLRIAVSDWRKLFQIEGEQGTLHVTHCKVIGHDDQGDAIVDEEPLDPITRRIPTHREIQARA